MITENDFNNHFGFVYDATEYVDYLKQHKKEVASVLFKWFKNKIERKESMRGCLAQTSHVCNNVCKCYYNHTCIAIDLRTLSRKDKAKDFLNNYNFNDDGQIEFNF